MYKLTYLISLKHSIVISEKSGDQNMVQTKDFIPGTSMLGVTANLFLKSYKPDNEFYRLFTRGDLKFSNAYIMNDKKTTIPAPFSIQHIKHFDEKAYDLLVFENKDNYDTKPFNGFINIDDTITTANVETKINFHHERDYSSGIAKKGVIFNYTAVSENQSFEGYIIGEKSDLEKISSILKENPLIRIGRSKTSQYALAEIKSITISEFGYSIPDETEKGYIMTTLSDTIIYNQFGYSTTDKRDIQKYLKVNIVKQFMRRGKSENFNRKLKLKTPSENTILAGSSFLIDKLPINYMEMELSGIGEKTNEGFGRISFGIQCEEVYSVKKFEKETKSKPVYSPLFIDIMSHKLLKNIKQSVILKATKKANHIAEANKVPNSLLGRLTLIANNSIKPKENKDDYFIQKIKNLPRKATNSLQDCRFETSDLYEFLVNFKLEENVDLSSINEINTKDKDNLPELKQLYLKNLFNQLRRANKTNIKKGGKQ